MGCSVIWYRRDLRLADHAALAEGCRRGSVVPLFILDQALLFHPETGSARVAFLLQSLRALDRDLRRLGSRLVVRRGDPVQELVTVVKACGADAVIAHTDCERIVGRVRDAAVNRRLAAEGIPIRWIEPSGASPDLLSYTAWRRQWQAAMQEPQPTLPGRLPLPALAATALPDQPIPDLKELGLPASRTPLPPAGTAAALERLNSFCDGPASRSYFWELSYPSARVTSGLSPYLKFGVISPRQVLQPLAGLAQQGGARQRSARQLASRLRWGAGMHQRFRHLPQLEIHSLWSAFDDPGSTSLDSQGQELYEAWRLGRTGFPIVDAAARCLAAEGGWLELNFRSRAIYASFLANLCGIDWRLGALHFMRQLIDGDCPIDHYQWAMQAGVTMAGNAAWTRIYHPGQVAVDRCDPQGLFIRRWLPELAELTNDQLGCPPPMAAYPSPILDYESARRRRLETLERQRQQIGDVRQAMARPPRDGDGAALDLFPVAVDLDSLEPRQWSALLSWFRPGRSTDRNGAAPSPRRSKARREAPGQLSLDLFTP